MRNARFFNIPVQVSDARSVLEICCGMEVGTIGLEFAGMKTVAARGINRTMLDCFQQWHPGSPTVCGDIGYWEFTDCD